MDDETVVPLIQSVQFRPDGLVEITYVEPHEQSDDMALVRVLIFAESAGGKLLLEVNDALLELLDEMLRQKSKPVATRRSGR